MILTNKKERGRFLRFMVVGTIGASSRFWNLQLINQFDSDQGGYRQRYFVFRGGHQ